MDASVCITGGMAHGEYKIWDGTGERVHETKTPLSNGDVGDEEGESGDVVSLGESGNEGVDHGVDAACERAAPVVPSLVG